MFPDKTIISILYDLNTIHDVCIIVPITLIMHGTCNNLLLGILMTHIILCIHNVMTLYYNNVIVDTWVIDKQKLCCTIINY